MVNGSDDSTLCLCGGNACNALGLGHQHLSLLVAKHLRLDHLLDLWVIERTIANRMNSGADHYEKVVAIGSALIHWRDIALLSIKEPLHGVTS